MIMQVTDQITLNPLSIDDIFKIFNTLDKEREYMREWLPFVDNTNVEEDTQNYVNHVLKTEDKQYTIYYESKFVGLIGYKGTDFDNHKTEIGYWLSQYAQGNGIMSRSVRKLMEYAFDELGINRIQIKVATENSKSRKIPEKLGFTLEGFERDGELHNNGHFRDVAIYSFLKREFK